MIKKSLSILVCFSMMLLCFTGCKSKEVKTVEELIDEIGEVELDSGEAIAEAQEAYDDLSASDRREVENIDVLEDAIEEYNSIPLGRWSTTVVTDDAWIAFDDELAWNTGDEIEHTWVFTDDGYVEGTVRNVRTNQTEDRGRYTWSFGFDGTVHVDMRGGYAMFTTGSDGHDYVIRESGGDYEMISDPSPNLVYTPQ